MDLITLPHNYSICRLAPDSPMPNWVQGPFTSITRTDDELSIICQQALVPGDVRQEAGWRCLRVAGTLAFDLVGVIASLSAALASENVSLFVVSTFDTDIILVKEHNLSAATEALRRAGHRVDGE